MKYAVELFSWGVEGEFEQAFFVSPIPIEKVLEKLKNETCFEFKSGISDDNNLSYMEEFEVVVSKLVQWGFEEIWINLDGYIDHLDSFINIEREQSVFTGDYGIMLELITRPRQTKDMTFVEQHQIKKTKKK